jgi:hypothetical protein
VASKALRVPSRSSRQFAEKIVNEKEKRKISGEIEKETRNQFIFFATGGTSSALTRAGLGSSAWRV